MFKKLSRQVVVKIKGGVSDKGTHLLDFLHFDGDFSDLNLLLLLFFIITDGNGREAFFLLPLLGGKNF